MPLLFFGLKEGKISFSPWHIIQGNFIVLADNHMTVLLVVLVQNSILGVLGLHLLSREATGKALPF